jgi:hypothetical protein
MRIQKLAIARLAREVRHSENWWLTRIQYRAAANTAMGWSNPKPTDRDDATVASRRRFGLATIVPFDAGKQTKRTTA